MFHSIKKKLQICSVTQEIIFMGPKTRHQVIFTMVTIYNVTLLIPLTAEEHSFVYIRVEKTICEETVVSIKTLDKKRFSNVSKQSNITIKNNCVTQNPIYCYWLFSGIFLFLFAFYGGVYFGWLVGWFLWYINPCTLFNVKSIFYVNNQFYLKQFSLA